MKTRNFPEKRNERRKRALANIRARAGSKDAEVDARRKEEITSLETRIKVSAREVRTKKVRRSKGVFT